MVKEMNENVKNAYNCLSEISNKISDEIGKKAINSMMFVLTDIKNFNFKLLENSINEIDVKYELDQKLIREFRLHIDKEKEERKNSRVLVE